MVHHAGTVSPRAYARSHNHTRTRTSPCHLEEGQGGRAPLRRCAGGVHRGAASARCHGAAPPRAAEKQVLSPPGLAFSQAVRRSACCRTVLDVATTAGQAPAPLPECECAERVAATRSHSLRVQILPRSMREYKIDYTLSSIIANKTSSSHSSNLLCWLLRLSFLFRMLFVDEA